MDVRLASFSEDVAARYGFLVDEFGFAGPEIGEEGYVGFSSRPWWIWVVLEERNNTVDTFVKYDDGARVLRAPMRRVLANARIDRVGRIRESAQTRVGMQKSLDTQAAALRLLTPVLRTRGDELIEPGG
jgi:hypothetical protein